MGRKRPAVLSSPDGKVNKFFGEGRWKEIEKRKKDYIKILKAKGTKPAKRKLKKLGSRKVNRFRNDCDHVLAKKIVAAVPPGSILTFEDLKGIKERCDGLDSWSFNRLFKIIEYKAEFAGIKTVKVNPRNTSRRCLKCGHTSKKNRQNQSSFKCQHCSYSLNADLLGARNIGMKCPAWHANQGGPLSAGPESQVKTLVASPRL